ncbi:MAG TPA: phosphoribosylformylglycinamidine synthase subunit PurQ [candidate division WOR-3 bacterium]|uniref:Phosphoribosylformylglycinamidine synthase subunit PurQ n=1 Tax=candidate division WOR-3 bacterium TaxID=2052148 RepID=A0A7C0VC99_UNCW3|nr:phosphoribosylformylglycinamidine synthase subunit PurQ [candidate division WOR-3 bacterium]
MVKALILRGPGTNCDVETAHALRIAGANVEDVYIKKLMESPEILKDFNIFVIPGGFTYGDDLGAGKVMAIEIEKFLFDELRGFVDKGGLVLGICNGFQILVKSGILPFLDGKQHLTLTMNTRGMFIDTWIELETSNRCVFLKGIKNISLPVANAEGRVVFMDEKVQEKVVNEGYACLFYRGFDPSGSALHIAGMTDETGRVLGMMPHPERNMFRHSHPEWKRGREGGDGLRIFINAVEYFR